MVRVLGLALIVVVVAGCTGPSPSARDTPAGPRGFEEASTSGTDGPLSPTSAPLPEEAAPAGPAVRHFDQEFTVSITGARSSAQSMQLNLDTNCVNFGKGNVWLVFNGTAEATWASATPFDQRLAIDVWDGGGQGLMFTNGGGASPSRIQYGQFRITQASTLGFAFIVQPMPDTVVAKLPVRLHIVFDYLGAEDTGAHVTTCNPQPRSFGGGDF